MPLKKSLHKLCMSAKLLAKIKPVLHLLGTNSATKKLIKSDTSYRGNSERTIQANFT